VEIKKKQGAGRPKSRLTPRKRVMGALTHEDFDRLDNHCKKFDLVKMYVVALAVSEFLDRNELVKREKQG